MSDSRFDQSDRTDRPAEVTDPLLWRLATMVAEAHEADDEGLCRNPSCAGATWPCAAWRSAQQGLRAAQGGPGPESEPPAGDDGDEAGDADPDPLTGWPTNLLPPGSRSLQPAVIAERDGTSPAAVSAA